MEQNPNIQESDIQAIVSSFTDNLAGEEREVVNMFEIREQALKKFAQYMIRKYYQNKYKSALRKAKTRINVIKELVKTEETYVSKLSLIDKTLKSDMKKLISEDDIKKIFSNIKEILGLNEQFIDYLKQKTSSLQINQKVINGKIYQDVQFNSRVFDNSIYQIIPFFKIYLEYMQNYEASQNFLAKLQETKKDVREYVENFEKEYDSISSLLITPVQRIPRYELLFKTLLEKTPKDHQDYIYTEKCYSKFIEVNQKVNQTIQKYLDNQKICELSQAFKNYNLNIIEQKKEFLFEERLSLVGDGEKSCIVSFLNNLLLVQERIDEESTKPIAWISLSRASQVKAVEDMKYFTHLFKVSGANNNLTFMADDEAKKIQVIKEIEKLITSIRQKDKDTDLDNIEVNILGTEEWNTTKIQKFTVYVAEVKILNITLKIWVRYSQLSALEKKIKSHFKDVEIDHFSTKLSWLNSHRTKIIEERKVQFESFLKKILTMKKIKESEIMPDILKDLGLPTDFYDLPYKSTIEEGNKNLYYLDDFNSDAEDSVGDDNSFQTNVNPIKENGEGNNEEENKLQDEGDNKRGSCGSQENSIRQKSMSGSVAAIGTFSSSETLKLFRKSKNQRASRITFQHSESLSQSERCLIDVEFLDGSKQETEINSQTRCFQICAEIAKKIGLKSYLDYRIFLKDSKGNFRVLDDDELLFKMLFPHQNSLQSNAVLVSNGSRSSKQEITLVNNQNILQSIHDTSRFNDTLQESSQFDFNPGFGQEQQPDSNAPLWKYSSETDQDLGLFKKTMKRLFSNFSEKYTIVFKKYLWLSPDQEEYDIRQDPVRLNLVSFQIFENIQQQRYKFTFKDYVLYSALYITIKYSSIAEKIIQLQKDGITNLTPTFPLQKLKEILPDIIYNSKEESYWIQNISETLIKMSDEVDKIQLKNQQIINKINNQHSQIYIKGSEISPKSEKQSKIQKNGKDISKFTSKQILGEKIRLMQMVVINAIKQNKLFGVTQFYVNTYKDTLRDAKELKENVWLGIKHNMIYVLGPEFKEELFQFKYDELVATKVFPKLIHLILQIPMNNFKFNTTQSFEIKQLISEYQQINQLLVKSPIKRNQNGTNNENS